MLPPLHRLLWLLLPQLLQWPLSVLPRLQLPLPQTKPPNQKHRHRLRLQRNLRELPAHRLKRHRRLHPKSPHLGSAQVPLLRQQRPVNHQPVLRWQPRRHRLLQRPLQP
uniref:Putative secreted protein n=1 Tax=Anopheles marajoara TaxID=58244 RepID=A0A2M4C8M6_9DIPT